MTDERGCEYDCENLAASRSSLVTADQCRLLQPPGTGLEGLRQVMNTKIPFNPACESAPTPTATSPLGWTRIVLESGRIPPTTTYEVRGLKLFVVRSSNPAPGCELFYEFDLRFNEVSGVKSTSGAFQKCSTLLNRQRPSPIGPFERFGQCAVEVLDEVQNSLAQFLGGSKGGALEQAAHQNAEPHLDLIEPRTMLRRVDKSDAMFRAGKKFGSRAH